MKIALFTIRETGEIMKYAKKPERRSDEQFEARIKEMDVDPNSKIVVRIEDIEDGSITAFFLRELEKKHYYERSKIENLLSEVDNALDNLQDVRYCIENLEIKGDNTDEQTT